MRHWKATTIKRRWYYRHREEILEQFKKDRLIVLRHYSGQQTPKCVCCNIDIFEFLGIDHIFGRTSGSVTDKLTGASLYSKLIGLKFPEGFQVLCHNCNQAKGLYGKCPHQTMRELDQELEKYLLLNLSSLKTDSENPIQE